VTYGPIKILVMKSCYHNF